MTKAIFLDRDGTLIDTVRDEELGALSVAFHPNQIRILPGVVTGLRLLQDAGFVLAIATNQPGPAKGQFSREAVTKTNQALVDALAREGITIAGVKVCMHHPEGGPGGDASLVGPCACRKPKPGMLLELIAELQADAGASWMVGDSTSDVEAAEAAGVGAGLLFDPKRCELCPLRHGPKVNVQSTRFISGASFDAMARAILAKTPADR